MRPTYFQDQLGRLADTAEAAESGVAMGVAGREPASGAWGLDRSDRRERRRQVTLLKILTRVMYPTAGRIEVTGRTGAMIEVRTGISPQLCGRENIYLDAPR